MRFEPNEQFRIVRDPGRTVWTYIDMTPDGRVRGRRSDGHSWIRDDFAEDEVETISEVNERARANEPRPSMRPLYEV
jgi:hypothetical protein